jgi:hypothetical protein
VRAAYAAPRYAQLYAEAQDVEIASRAQDFADALEHSSEIHWRFITMCFDSPSRELEKEVRG